jgi:branched-chain amino acid transport system ATP-binding protein
VSEAILQVAKLRKQFGGLAATDCVDLDVRRGELVAIIGPNGAGKTTLINLLTGVYPCDSGTIRFEGEDVTSLPVHSRSLRGLARSFQITSVFPEMTVLENVAIAAQAHRGHSFRFWRKVTRDKDIFDAARASLTELGLHRHLDRPAAMLAHGEKRILEIAMALVTDPKMLLLDEPMAGLGVEESRTMISFIQTLKGKLSILLIEHDMDAVFALADRILVLASGAIVASGPPEQIRTDPKVKLAYLGDDEDA